jgi:ubiquinone/menaquinone biosynthesis C-methylase UbiE
MDLDEYRKVSHDTWDRMAAGWESWNEFLARSSRPVSDGMVEALAPQPGQTILELAAGTGVTGFTAAAALRDGGHLLMTDFSEPMLEAARRRGSELELENVEYRVMDAEKMDLEDDSVDGVLCRWGYMLMADPGAALRETRRVLRKGGRLSFSVWGAPEDNPWASVPGRVLVQRGHMPPPEAGAPGIFAMANPERIHQLVTGAGFEPPQLQEVRVSWRFEDFEQSWRFTNELAGALALVIARLDERERDAVRADIESAVADFASNGGYEFPGVSLNVLTG